MTVSTSSTVFKTRNYDKVLSGVAVLLSSLFAVAAVVVLLVSPDRYSYALAALCLIATGAAVESMFTGIVVTADGITKRPVITRGFSFQWRDVESWEQLPRRFDDAPCIRFRVRGDKIPRVVFNYEVEQPGVEFFVSYVKQHVSQQEAA